MTTIADRRSRNTGGTLHATFALGSERCWRSSRWSDQAKAAKRYVARGHADQASAAVDRVPDNALRPSGHVGTLCRDRVLERASPSLAISA